MRLVRSGTTVNSQPAAAGSSCLSCGVTGGTARFSSSFRQVPRLLIKPSFSLSRFSARKSSSRRKVVALPPSDVRTDEYLGFTASLRFVGSLLVMLDVEHVAVFFIGKPATRRLARLSDLWQVVRC
jgi:hypothetical protein